MSIQKATQKRTGYENFEAECPNCGVWNTFNRASDLRTFKPVAGRNVACFKCGEAFRILGDSVNSAHEMLIFDCYELIERKRYMNCILNLTQAYEIFFALFFRVEFLYKPFSIDQDLQDLNRLSEELQVKMERHSFTAMRALFLGYIVNASRPGNLTEARATVASLPCQPSEPRDATIQNLTDGRLMPLLRALKATRIYSLRNNVVHKKAYRPTREQVDAALQETREILFPLTALLDLHDEINWYMRRT